MLDKQPSRRASNMVHEHLVGKDILDEKVLAAMQRVPRHKFVPEPLGAHAYRNKSLPIGFEQTISAPYMVGLMTQTILSQGGQKFLEIGTGSGYQTAVLSQLARQVFSIERIQSLALKAQSRLDAMNIFNVSIRSGDGALGWREYAPFDGILVTAAMKKLPEAYASQLADGGLLVGPFEESDGKQNLYALQKRNDKFAWRKICSCQFVPFVSF